MTEADLDRLRAAVAALAHRTGIVETSVGPVVVKRQRAAPSRWRAAAFGALARALGIGVLRPVPGHGGRRGQALEVERLRSLRRAGVRVPAVLHVEAGFFAMEHVAGPSLAALVERGGAAGFEAWRRGLAALAEVHAHGAALSHAFARNCIVAREGLAMVDFEDDPLAVMSLEAAQARDWLAYLHSTLWLLDRPLAETRAALAVRLADAAPPVRSLVEGAGRRLTALRWLPRTRRPLGREVAGARALGAVFPLPPLAFQTIDAVF